MKLFYFTVGLLLSILLLTCNHHKTSLSKSQPKIDTSKSFKINDAWVTPKLWLKYDTLGKSTSDTLDLVICGKYVYSPFGEIKNKLGFKSSLLNNFNVTNKTETMDSGPYEFQILKYKSSKLIYFFDNDPEASVHSNILKGEIYDEDVHFSKGIHVGMSTKDFYNTLFSYCPDDLLNRLRVVVLESCVQDIKQVYTFKSGVLESVKFVNDTYWIVNY